MTAKQQALQAIKRLPKMASYKDISEEIGVLAAVREAEDDINNGRVRPLEEVRKMIPQWISKSSSRTAR